MSNGSIRWRFTYQKKNQPAPSSLPALLCRYSQRVHDAHVPRWTRDPSCIMDVLSDAQWRTNTPGLLVLSPQGRRLGNKRRLPVKESGRGGCNTHLLHSTAAPTTRLCRFRPLASWSARVHSRPPRRVCIHVDNRCIDVYSHYLMRWGATQTDPEFTQLLQQRNGEPMQGWMQHRASSLLYRSRRPRGKILAHQAHLATCHQGEAAIRQDLDGRPPSSLTRRGSLFRVQTTSWSHMELHPWSGGGESHAGAPLLKGQEPDIRACGRLAWIKWQIQMRESCIRHLMRAGTCKFTANVQIYFITTIRELHMLNTKLPFTSGRCQRKQILVQTNQLCLVILFWSLASRSPLKIKSQLTNRSAKCTHMSGSKGQSLSTWNDSSW